MEKITSTDLTITLKSGVTMHAHVAPKPKAEVDDDGHLTRLTWATIKEAYLYEELMYVDPRDIAGITAIHNTEYVDDLVERAALERAAALETLGMTQEDYDLWREQRAMVEAADRMMRGQGESTALG